MDNWIDRQAALALLGVKPQTLYAYVSRGRIDMQPDPLDSRRSLYRADDVAALAARRARGRRPATIAASSMTWGEPSVPTSLSTVRHGKLYYRGKDAVELARRASLEDVAALLWDTPQSVSFTDSKHVVGGPFQTLAAMVADSQPMLGRGRQRLCQDAAQVIGTLALAAGAPQSSDSLHVRLARAWKVKAGTAVRIRQALVAMADHDLNASTFAARVAASTGASMAAAVLAGLCTLSGPRHGGASAALMSLLDDAGRSDAATAVRAWLDRHAALPGFDHPLYPAGDPRAAIMLEDIVLDPLMASIRDRIMDETGALPNCDFGLTALACSCALPLDAPFTIFMLARCVGWCAHAMEQILNGALIRPLGRYEGPAPP